MVDNLPYLAVVHNKMMSVKCNEAEGEGGGEGEDEGKGYGEVAEEGKRRQRPGRDGVELGEKKWLIKSKLNVKSGKMLTGKVFSD